ncbi:MAG: protein kinase [Gemmatimonadetes bacterium]|nr:protein kinase [Gemmatimonadota bacterium]
MTTPNDRWLRLSALFDEALELPDAARADWLAAAAPDDPALRHELTRMLGAHARTGPLDRNLAPLAEAEFHGRLDAALGDRYTLGETLGVGGTAAVFLAHESKHDRRVVLKVLQPGLAAAIGPTRFLEEVRITARLSHPHILPLLDSGEVDGLLFYAMPYLGGETLRERLARDGALPLTEAVGLLRDIAAALAHAHSAGVIHRDLKPENVLSVGAHAYLLDFGIAKLEADVESVSVTHPGFAIGTPGYMAPEQAAGQAVDHRADLYAWGLLAREILTGGRSAAPLGEQRPDLPRSLVALVEACLAIDPAERPATASSLVAALDGLVAPVRERSWTRRLVPFAAVGAVVFAAVMARREPPSSAALVGPIAVTPLVNETGDSTLSGWGRLAGDWVTQGLHEASLLAVVPWPSILLAAEQHAKSGAPDLAATVREETGAALVVSGSYYRTGDSLRFQVSITDMRDGRLVAAIPPVVVVKDSAASAVRELRDRVMGALAVALDERMPPEVELGGLSRLRPRDGGVQSLRLREGGHLVARGVGARHHVRAGAALRHVCRGQRWCRRAGRFVAQAGAAPAEQPQQLSRGPRGLPECLPHRRPEPGAAEDRVGGPTGALFPRRVQRRVRAAAVESPAGSRFSARLAQSGSWADARLADLLEPARLRGPSPRRPRTRTRVCADDACTAPGPARELGDRGARPRRDGARGGARFPPRGGGDA